MAAGTWCFVLAGLKPVYAIQLFGGSYAIYIGLLALALNMVISLAGTMGSYLKRNDKYAGEAKKLRLTTERIPGSLGDREISELFQTRGQSFD